MTDDNKKEKIRSRPRLLSVSVLVITAGIARRKRAKHPMYSPTNDWCHKGTTKTEKIIENIRSAHACEACRRGEYCVNTAEQTPDVRTAQYNDWCNITRIVIHAYSVQWNLQSAHSNKEESIGYGAKQIFWIRTCTAHNYSGINKFQRTAHARNAAVKGLYLLAPTVKYCTDSNRNR